MLTDDDLWFICIYSILPHFLVSSIHVRVCGCHWQAVAVKMTFYASDSLNAWSSEWMYGVCASACVCVEAETVSAGGGRKISGSYQRATRTWPISSHCWAINGKLIAFHRGKEKQGAGRSRFHFLEAKLQHDAASTPELSTYACNPSFPFFPYLFKQMGLTETKARPHYTDKRKEGQINRWLQLERGGWDF